MVHIGIKGHVIALDSVTGQEIWRTRLRGDFVNLALADGNLYATANGQLYCLDPGTGHIRWKNELKGLGFGLISIATGSQQIILKQERDQQEAATTGATSAT